MGTPLFARFSTVAADGQLAGTPSVLFDATAVLLSDAGAQALCSEGAAVGA